MKKQQSERRRFARYVYEDPLRYQFAYNLSTPLKYEVKQKYLHGLADRKHLALSLNISVEGICFRAPEKLQKGTELNLEVYLPKYPFPIRMEGRVRWCYPNRDNFDDLYYYETGVALKTVNGQNVKESIYHDDQYDVDWSAVLESVLGKYKAISFDLKENA